MVKTLQLMKSLCVAAVLLLGSVSTWATDVPYSIGSEGCGYRAQYSDPYTVENGETLHITFTNNNYATSSVWCNYILEATSAVDKHDAVYFDLRGDNYAFDQGTFVQNYNGNCLSDLNGATVDNYITYAGGVITVNQIFTKAEVTTYNRVYTYTVAGNPKSVIIYVTEEAAQVTITNVETSKWTTVWTTDFSSAPSGMTYSVTNGSTEISNGYLVLNQGGGSGNRAMNIAFTDSKFNVDTDWIMEFDWSYGLSNQNESTGTFATDQGTAFIVSWGKDGTKATIKDAADNTLTSTLPPSGYNTSNMSKRARFTVKGVVGNGIFLTVSQEGTTYVNNVKVSSTFGYPKTFNGSLGRAVSRMFLDNIVFQTPAVAGFVASPTSEITGAAGTSRKFTLSCLTDGATIYYATSDLEKGAAGWVEYTGEVTTDATTIYAYAKDNEDNTSEKMNFATGAGTIIDLKPATVTHSNKGVYTITSNQSTILGTPTATIHYQIDGGSEQTSTNASVNVNIAADGTLTYWLTADGYGATDPADETVYAAVAYVVTRTIDFKTSNTNEFAIKGDETTVTGDTHTYYLYKDQDGNLIAEDILATSFENDKDQSWRIQRYYGGTATYSKTEYIALKNLAKGQIVQFACTSAPSIVSNLTVVPASTYTGTYTYTATAEGDVIVSLARGVVITTITLCSSSVSTTLDENGYATFASQYPLDLTNMKGATAYSAVVKGTNIDFNTLSQTVPANTGILLHGEANATVTIPVVAEGTTVKNNALLVNTSGETFDAVDGFSYFAMKKNIVEGKYVVFAMFNPATVAIPANKAYLKVAETLGSRLTITFNGGATGISTVEAVKAETEGIYNLNGQRIAAPAKGLYIVNGKKVVLK